MSKISLVALGVLLLSAPVYAQSVPPLMNYQGYLTDATGQPLPTGQYTLTFNVYNVPTAGTAVWGPQAITADVIDGYFNVVLSADSTGGDSISTAFTAQPRYVSIRVDAAAEMLPRQQVLSAPYAIQAGRAGGADAVSSTSPTGNIFPSTGNVGIGTTTPEQSLAVTGAAKFTGTVDIVGSLTTTGATSVGGLLTSSTLQFTVQKFCSVRGPGWRDSFMVPNSWTIANCSALFEALQDGSQYRLGCIFSNGTVSESLTNQPVAPTPNCGW